MAEPYGLTRGMADLIVTAVRHNPQCRDLLPDVGGFKFFSPIGHAGTARNLFNFVATGAASITKDHSGKSFADYLEFVSDSEACTGVAATTARALLAVAGRPGYEFLLDAGSCDRNEGDPMHDFHTATAVTVTGNRIYVFDWHSTLELGNPLIFSSPSAFRSGGPYAKYTLFWGWS